MASSPTSSLVRSKQIPSGRATTELDRAARDLGAQLAAESADRRKPSQSAPDARLLLTDHGYEPYDDEGTIRLRNCPFAQLAKRHGELVCRANLVFVEGLLQGRQHRGLQAILDPLPQRCCVALI
jgi:predicted ArsR family transcriptional regulator